MKTAFVIFHRMTMMDLIGVYDPLTRKTLDMKRGYSPFRNAWRSLIIPECAGL